MEQCRSVLRMAETEFDAGWNEAGGIAEVVADAIMDHEVDGVTLPWTSVWKSNWPPCGGALVKH